MAHNILITGASGYLGGSLLAHWKDASLPPHRKLYALVRSEEQDQAVKQYGAESLLCDLNDHDNLRDSIINKEISIIFFLVDSLSDKHQPTMIRALHEVQAKTGKVVHFLHTAGAKHFSEHAGLSTEELLLDTDPDLYDILKDAVSPHPYFAQTTKTNFSIIDTCEEYGVRGYIFAPCIVDNSTLYLEMLRNMLLGKDMGYNKQGFYLASSGSVRWNDIYCAFAKALAKRGVVDDDEVKPVDDTAVTQMGEALGVPQSLVTVMLGGNCTFTPVHGGEIGWKAQNSPEHILEAADEEVDFILKNLKD